ncbi:MAG: glycosyltransferase family 2 protein [bacterium]
MEVKKPSSHISVVISTRDRGESIKATIQSALASEYPHVEVVVVDQSEDDRTERAIQPFLDDSRLRYIRSDTKGCSSGRNIGIRQAQGSTIFITDDDCELKPNCLKELINVLNRDLRVGIVFGNVLPGPHDVSTEFIPAYVRSESFLARNMNEKHQVEGISACMGLRRDVWLKLNGFDQMLGTGSALKSGAETDFTIRALLNGYFVYETPAMSVIHHGFRNWEQGRHLIHRYYYGTGAMFGKLLKCGYGSIVIHLFRLARRMASRENSRTAMSLRGQDFTPLRIKSFVNGFFAGIFTPVNRKTAHFSWSKPDITID